MCEETNHIMSLIFVSGMEMMYVFVWSNICASRLWILDSGLRYVDVFVHVAFFDVQG